MIAHAIQDNLCYRFRSQGLPKELVHNFLNIINKWVNKSGVEWTVDRLKAIHHYYIEYKANEEPISDFLKAKCPKYIGIRRDGLPKGIFKNIFKIKDMKCALNLLSCHADFVNDKLTKTQYNKFIKGISTETSISLDGFKDIKCNMLFVLTNKKVTFNTGYFTSLKRIGMAINHDELDYMKSNVCYKSCAINLNEDYSKYGDLLKLSNNGKPLILNSRLYIKKEFFPDFSIISTRSVPAFDDIWNFKDNIHIKEVQELFKNSLPINDIGKPLNLDIPSKLVKSKRQRIYRVNSITDVAVAYAYSWYCVPKLTIDYIGKQYGWLYLPDGLLHNEIHELTHTDGLSLTINQRMNLVGTIGIIQEKSLKARVVANPNKVTQFYLKPLGQKLYGLLKTLPTDCTYDQDSGSLWCQKMLDNGIPLSAVDLSSATDTLSVDASFKLIEKFFFQNEFDDESNSNLDPSWVNARNYFLDICKLGLWSVIDHSGKEQFVSYKQGQPMGTFPSFALLGLTNNIVASFAALKNGLDPIESFRVIGDDIVIRKDIANDYIQLITSIGGQVNKFKTVESSLLTEFAGGIITKFRNIRKTSKSINLDDNNFLSKVKSFGSKLIPLLKPKQKRIFMSKAMYIPGVAIDGPWSNDSFGIPLDLRLDYAFTLSSKLEQRVKPDQRTLNSEQFVNFLYWSLMSKDRGNLMAFCCPSTLYEDFQSSIIFEYASMHFDQIESRCTLLDSLTNRDLPTFTKFIKDKLRSEMDSTLYNHQRIKDYNKLFGIDIPKLIYSSNNTPSGELLSMDNLFDDLDNIENIVKLIKTNKPIQDKCFDTYQDFCRFMKVTFKSKSDFEHDNNLRWLFNFKNRTFIKSIKDNYFNEFSQLIFENTFDNVSTSELVDTLYYTLWRIKNNSSNINAKVNTIILNITILAFDYLSNGRHYHDNILHSRDDRVVDFVKGIFNNRLFPEYSDYIININKTFEKFVNDNKYLNNFPWFRLVSGTALWGNSVKPLDDRFDAQYLKTKFVNSKQNANSKQIKNVKYNSMGHSL